jgi:hypothetical protein
MRPSAQSQAWARLTMEPLQIERLHGKEPTDWSNSRGVRRFRISLNVIQDASQRKSTRYPEPQLLTNENGKSARLASSLPAPPRMAASTVLLETLRCPQTLNRCTKGGWRAWEERQIGQVVASATEHGSLSNRSGGSAARGDPPGGRAKLGNAAPPVQHRHTAASRGRVQRSPHPARSPSV